MTTDEKAFNLVEETREHVYSGISGLLKTYNEFEDLYFGHTSKQKKGSTKSNVFDPIVFEQVEHVVSHNFANLPRGSFVPVEDSDDTDTYILDQLLKYQQGRPQQNFRQKMVNMGRRMALFGQSFAILHWRYERKKVAGKFTTTWNSPCLYDLNIYDCYPDIDATSPHDMEFFGYDDYVTFEQLEEENSISQGEKKYHNLNLLKELIKNPDSARTPYRDRANEVRKITKTPNRGGRFIVRRFYWRDRWITTVPDYNLTIEDRDNPYWHGQLPVLCLRDHDYPDTVHATGEVAPIRSMAVAQNQLINMRFDNVKMILEPPLQARASSLQYQDTWVSSRNAVWVMDQIGDVQPFVYNDVTGNTFQATSNFLLDEVSRRMGRVDFISRNESSSDKTATEIKAAVGESNSRLKYKENNIDQFVQEMNTMWLQLDQQYLTEDISVRVLGREATEKLKAKYGQSSYTDPQTGMEYPMEPKFRASENGDYGFLSTSPEDIVGQFDFQVESGSTRAVDVQNEVNELTSAIGLLTSVAPILEAKEGVKVNLKTPVENLLMKMGIKNLDKVLEVIPQEQLLQQQYDEQQGMGAIQQGNSGGVEGFGGAAGVPIV